MDMDMDMDIDNKIIFNMSDLQQIISEIECKKNNFESLVTQKVAENVKEWIRQNQHHKFPKSKCAWEKVLFSQFGYITIIIDPIALMNIEDEDVEHYINEIKILKERIKKYLSKSRNNKLHLENYTKSMKIIRSFCRFKHMVNCSLVVNELYDSNIIDQDSKINSNIWTSKKRSRMEDNISTDNSYYDTALSLSSVNDVKRSRKQ